MQGRVAGYRNLKLKSLAAEASQALAQLDAERLEELALSCEALHRKLALTNADRETRRAMAEQARDAAADMAILGRVLEATRANLGVMNRLREMRMERLEYTVRAPNAAPESSAMNGDGDGNH